MNKTVLLDNHVTETKRDRDIRFKAKQKYSMARFCITISIALIALAGCDLTDNPPKTLHMAAFKGNIKAAKKFVHDGIDVNSKGQDGERPLHFAVYGNRADMVTFLLDNGAEINAPNNSQSTPLHAAAWKGYLDVAELLITRGAEVNAVNKMGKTPLDNAIDQEHTAMADLIRKHNGNEK